MSCLGAYPDIWVWEASAWPIEGADQVSYGAQIQNIRRPSLRPVEPEVQGVWAVPYAAALHNSVEDIHEVDNCLHFPPLSLRCLVHFARCTCETIACFARIGFLLLPSVFWFFCL